MIPFIDAIDQKIFDLNHAILYEPVVQAMKLITALAETESTIAISLLLFYAAWKRGLRLAPLSILTGTVLVRWGNFLLKGVFTRPRPISSVHMAEGFSFPSGHSANIAFLIVIFFGVFKTWLDHPPQRRANFTFWMILIGFSVGLSRIILEVHWASDVIAGWTFGLLVGYLTRQFGFKETQIPEAPHKYAS